MLPYLEVHFSEVSGGDFWSKNGAHTSANSFATMAGTVRDVLHFVTPVGVASGGVASGAARAAVKAAAAIRRVLGLMNIAELEVNECGNEWCGV